MPRRLSCFGIALIYAIRLSADCYGQAIPMPTAPAELPGSSSRAIAPTGPIPPPPTPVTPLPTVQLAPQSATIEPTPMRAGPELPPEEAIPVGRPASMFEAGMLRAGRIAFEQQCTACHDAAKSLEKSKGFPDWLATVRRMADKPDASIPKNEIEPIAAYLTDNNPPAAGNRAAAINQMFAGLTFNGTVSPTWRGGSQDLQNGGFFPDAWLGTNFNNGSPLTARATACISCHNDGGGGSTIELVDAALRLDAMQALGWQHPRIRVAAEFGRFIVPFGAFAAQSNPGVYRTVTRPLMYNMGMRVRDADLGDPVLPMPFSNQGASFNVGLPITAAMNFGFDGYVINGLQGTADGVDFDMSRSYNAVNSTPSIGGRATLGNDFLKLGASALGGTMTPTGGVGPNGDRLGYHLFGVDAQVRYQDLLRFQFEYALRDSGHLRTTGGGDLVNAPDRVDGCYAETEVLLFDYLHTSFLFRFDWQRQGARLPAGSGILFSPFSVDRLTYGLNFTLNGGSLLMFNYEYWMLPTGFDNINVFGVRWAATF